MKITKLLFTSAIAILSIAAPFHSASVTAQTVRSDSIKIMSRASCSVNSISKGDVGHAAIAFYDNSFQTSIAI